MTFFGTNTLGMGLILPQLRQWQCGRKIALRGTRDARIFGKRQRGTSHGGVGLALHIKNVAHASAMPRAGFLLLPHTVWSHGLWSGFYCHVTVSWESPCSFAGRRGDPGTHVVPWKRPR